MKYDSIKDFREKAGEEGLRELERFIKDQKKRTEAFPNETYNFSYSAASKELRQHGFLGGIKKPEPKVSEKPAQEEFVIYEWVKGQPFKARSVMLEEDVLRRLDKLSSDHGQYSKKAVINQILKKGLEHYGY